VLTKYYFTGTNSGTCTALTYHLWAWGCGRCPGISVWQTCWSQETDSWGLLPWWGLHWPLG